MKKLSTEFKKKIREQMLAARRNYSGTNGAFAKTLGISSSIFSRINNEEFDGVLSDPQWLRIAREFNVSNKQDNWKVARTEVYNKIEGVLNFCKEFNKSMIIIDKWGIGKTETARNVVRNTQDAFYLDCSQCSSLSEFTRALAKLVGVNSHGRRIDVKADLKYYINNYLENAIIVLDDAGDLKTPAFLELKEYWNGTENQCAWILIGDDSLQEKLEKGKRRKKVGYGAIHSRFNSEYVSLSPVDPKEHQQFMKKLLTDVAKVNIKDKSKIPALVNKCLSEEKAIRALKTLIQYNDRSNVESINGNEPTK